MFHAWLIQANQLQLLVCPEGLSLLGHHHRDRHAIKQRGYFKGTNKFGSVKFSEMVLISLEGIDTIVFHPQVHHVALTSQIIIKQPEASCPIFCVPLS
jgi:hypothetical protein